MQIPYTKRVLDNGLQAIVHEDHRCPIVAVNVWYHVGSKNEQPGRTGFAHLFEHLMFEGSEHHDSGYFPPLQLAGGLLNGSTNADRTNYWEVVPSNAVELALWLESDRMGHLLPALTEAKFRNQRDVVLNERRQNYENRPYGLAAMAVVEALYPPGHPYHWLTIGAPEDLHAATLDEVRAFFATYYHPANASIAVAGDIETEAAFALLEACFGEIPAGPAPARVEAAATLACEVRLVVEDRVELPRLYLAWHSPGLYQDGDAEMDLAADILGSGKSSRLYRALVYDRSLASEVASVQNSRELSGFFQAIATAAPGHTLAELDAVISSEMTRLIVDGPTGDEVERAKAQMEASFVYGLQTLGGFNGKSDQLNSYNVFLGDPGYVDRDLARYQDTTGDAVRTRLAATAAGRRRVAVSVVPRGRPDLALPDSVRAVLS
jgi:zinc protease